MPTPRRRRGSLLRLALAVLAAQLVAAACSGGSGGRAGGERPLGAGGATVVRALDSLRFEPETIEVPAGELDFELFNDGASLPHTFVVEDFEEDLELSVVGDGDRDRGTIALEVGTYTFFCDIPDHRGGGMVGTLVVQ